MTKKSQKQPAFSASALVESARKKLHRDRKAHHEKRLAKVAEMMKVTATDAVTRKEGT